MKLYHVKAGIDWWVATKNLDEVILLVRAHEICSCGECEGNKPCREIEEDLAEATVTELTQKAAEKFDFFDDNTGGKHNMWVEFLKKDKPCVVACSEW